MKINLKRRKLHKTNQRPYFLGGSFSNRDIVRASIQLEVKDSPSILKDDFSWRTEPPIFTPIAPELLDQSHEISWAFPALNLTSKFLPQFIVTKAPRMEAPWGFPSFTEYLCEDFPSRTTWMRKDEIRPNTDLIFNKTWVCEEDQHAKTWRKP